MANKIFGILVGALVYVVRFSALPAGTVACVGDRGYKCFLVLKFPTRLMLLHAFLILSWLYCEISALSRVAFA